MMIKFWGNHSRTLGKECINIGCQMAHRVTLEVIRMNGRRELQNIKSMFKTKEVFSEHGETTTI
jgi:hypothetical protein